MDASEMQRLMNLYSAGKVPEDYFRNKLAEYRQAAFSYERGPAADYYRQQAINYGARAEQYKSKIADYEAELLKHVKNLVRQLNTRGQNDYYTNRQHSRAMEKLFTLISGGLKYKETTGNVGSIFGSGGTKKFRTYYIDEENLKFKPAEAIVKSSTSRRGNLVTPWGQLAVDYGGAMMSYEDYARRRDEMRSKRLAQEEADRLEQETRFNKKRDEFLASAEKMFGMPRERVYTERSL